MSGQTYSVRPHMFAGDETYGLEGDALTVQSGATLKRVPFSDIESFRLVVYPGLEEQQGQCTVLTRAHGKLTVRSHHYAALGDFENRAAGYGAFLRELFRRVQAANPATRFIWGSGGIRIAWLLVLVIAVVGWLIWAAVLYTGAVEIWLVVIVFLILLLATRLGLYAFAANKVSTFDPLDPPLP